MLRMLIWRIMRQRGRKSWNLRGKGREFLVGAFLGLIFGIPLPPSFWEGSSFFMGPILDLTASRQIV